ncbi:hypothetical protein L596_011060 [Steinernema carpocapsae]|uniref:Mediator of RNA polymerase II transcription subunit 8 n=1 Tax=Steinernema carpocapsae TaxID=34508 RepID=A0A4U5NT71_STECR|nr:hypothetical protein L596_011060 [Steinernema carpocapsae]
MQRDPEKISQAIHNIDKKIEELRSTAEQLLQLLDHNEKVKWQDMLDKFSSLAGGMNQVQTMIKKSALTAGHDDYGAFLRQHVVVPQKLNPDLDQDLVVMTQGRVHVWNHDTLPDYMRTKLNPEVEADENSIDSTKSADQIGRQINQMTKHIDLILNTMTEHSRQADERFQAKQTFNAAETSKLVRGIMNGENLKPPRGASSGDSANRTSASSGPTSNQLGSVNPPPRR